MMLLGYFGESRAHQVIVDLFRLPTELVGDLFDDKRVREHRSNP